MNSKTVVLTFDDSVVNHLSFVAPMLKKYNFGATFYVNEPGCFANSDRKNYLDWPRIKELAEAGFEIGNHTRNHRDCRTLGDSEFEAELGWIEEKCREYAIPAPVTFAYPGGPVAENVIGILKARGYLCARSVANETFHVGKDDPFRMPAAAVQDNSGGLFEEMVLRASGDDVSVMVFHGVPDPEHSWVNTAPERFAACMDFLVKKKCCVIGMRDLFKK